MKTMKLIVTLTMLLFSSGSVMAEDGDAEATIRLMGNAEMELPEAVTKEITLPEHLLAADDQVRAVEKAEKGLEKANERLERRENGLSNADEARERGAEMKEKAQENRENRGRSDDRPDPPGQP
jgi:hypothetical protein